MLKHTKVYLAYFDLGIDDYIQCELCDNAPASGIHHITPKRMGGTKNPDINKIENLGAVCQTCHDACHNSKDVNEDFRVKHLGYIDLFKVHPEEYYKRRGL